MCTLINFWQFGAKGMNENFKKLMKADRVATGGTHVHIYHSPTQSCLNPC